LANGNEKWEVIVKFDGDILRLEQLLPVEVEVLSQDYAIITLFAADIPDLVDFPEIEYIEQPKELTLSELYPSCLYPVISKTQDLRAASLTGRGVITAFLDSGIDYTHRDFRNADGSSRILYMWDQTDDSGAPPNGFTAGTEYSKEQIDAALASGRPYDFVREIDFIGHGTAVAGVAAGNGNASNGRYKGVAPESSLIVVKLGEKGRESFARTTELMRALSYVIRTARELNMPVAVNISYGTNNGSHDGTSLFETFVSSMSDVWKCVIVAASGNEGSAGHHFECVIRQGVTQEIPFFVIPNLKSLYMTAWKDFVDGMSFELLAPNGQSTGIMEGSIVVREVRIANTDVSIFYSPPSHYNEGQEVLYQFSPNPVISDGIWTLKVTGTSIAASGRLNIWLPTVEQVTTKTAFFSPTPEMTFTLPSTARKVIAVGGYDSATGRAADFSGRGFAFYGRLAKPDIVAPAINVMTTSTGGGYDIHTGTSMAAPYVTGASAVLMEWGIVKRNDPFLFGQKISAYLKLGAVRNQNISYPNSIWGYGISSLSASLDYLLRGR